jgi:putative phage-type endonuclease
MFNIVYDVIHIIKAIQALMISLLNFTEVSYMKNHPEIEQIQGIGGSDIAALLGLSPYKSPLALWAQKVGHPVRKPIEGVHLRFGQFVEPFVALEYERITGLHTVEHTPPLLHPDNEFMYGHLDRLVVPSPETPAVVDGVVTAETLLECKTTSIFNKDEWGQEGSDQVPNAYLLQCAWYMAITGCARADIAVLLGNQDFRLYRIHRDEKLEGLMIDQAKRFWFDHVLARVPPEPQTINDVKLLFPQEQPNQSVEASPDVVDALQQLKELQNTSQALEEKAEAIKIKIMQAMGQAERLSLNGQVLATWKSTRPTQRIDTQAIKTRYPEIANECAVITPASRRFVVKDFE